jgi:uncharacterized membrane protein required for colicin V production
MYINLVLALVFFACVASTIQNGLWTNIILLINVVSAALVATCYYEPVAELFDDLVPSYGAANDFVSVWLVFAGSLGILDLGVTDFLSRVKVRYLRPVDRFGGMFLSCWIGWVTVCFTTMTLHMAPLPRNFAGGDFQPTPDATMAGPLEPDHRWLGFVQKMSRGGYRCSPENVFDPRADFILKYAQRRKGFENGGSWDAPGPAKAALAQKAAAAAAKAPVPNAPGTP